MKYSTKTGTLAKLSTGALVTGLKTARQVTRALKQGALLEAATTDFSDRVGHTLTVRLPKSSSIKRLVIVGGADAEQTETQFRKMISAAVVTLKSVPTPNAIWTLTATKVSDRDAYWKAACSLFNLSTAIYEFNEHKSRDRVKNKLTLRIVHMHTDARAKASVQRAVKFAQALKSGLDLARDLGNQPPNVCNPTYLLSEARKVARLPKMGVTALDEKRMRELGMGAFLAVSQASKTPGKMIIVTYKGGKPKDAPYLLIGKGITFDTGGISLKPPAAMDEMKFDMCGAATVLGATRAVAEANLPINLVTILAAAENMPGGNATRPGDIVHTHSGQTVEILNTDAEGRLVLCDALSYAERFKPRVIIDVATLTGACVVALGSFASAVFSKNDALANDLLAAGDWTGDRAWRLPLWDDYEASLNSNFADIANVAGRDGSASKAACFLSRFTKNPAWAHMDIAGSAYHGGARKGATGRPVALLFRYLAQQA
ncbi:MAG: leucyl aminopeptidase [Gammaproteobacteria bacterium]|nr:leucyl aminopeptidase [Gammaproteobacteria bacterium]